MNSCPSPRGHRGPCALTGTSATVSLAASPSPSLSASVPPSAEHDSTRGVEFADVKCAHRVTPTQRRSLG